MQHPLSKTIRHLSLPGLVALAGALAGPTALADTYSWTGLGGDDNWSTGANWSGTAPASANTTDVVFAGSTRTTPYADAAWSVKTLTFASGAAAFTLSGSTLTVYGYNTTNTGAVVNNSSNTQTIGNAIKVASGNQIAFLAANGSMILNGGIAMGSNVGFLSYGGRTLTANGLLSGAGSININGGGNVVVTNASNSYTGNTSVYTGTLVVGGNVATGSNSTLGNSSNAISLGASSAATTPSLLVGGAFTVDRAVQIVSPSSGVTSATLGGNSAHVSTFSRDVTMGSTSGVAQGMTVTAASGGRVNITGSLVRASGATGAGDAVTKAGAGIVNLAGSANTYSGATTVNVGTLLVTGTLSSGGGAVAVNTGATLGGDGRIDRAVTVNGGGILSPGDVDSGGISKGGRLLVGSLSLSNTSILAFNLDAPTSILNDEIVVGGNLTLDGVLNVTSSGNLAYGKYTLATYSGTLTDNILSIGSISLQGGYTASIDTLTPGVVSLSVVPEPSVWSLIIAAGVLGFAAFRIRKTECA